MAYWLCGGAGWLLLAVRVAVSIFTVYREAVDGHRRAMQCAPESHAVLLAARLAMAGAVLAVLLHAVAAVWAYADVSGWLERDTWFGTAYFGLFGAGAAGTVVVARETLRRLATDPVEAPVMILCGAVTLVVGPLGSIALLASRLVAMPEIPRATSGPLLAGALAIDLVALVSVGGVLALGTRTLLSLPPLVPSPSELSDALGER